MLKLRKIAIHKTIKTIKKTISFIANKTSMLLLTIFLTNCRTINISNICPDIPFYTKEEQVELDKITKQVNNALLNKVLIDYGNLREDLRECNSAQ